MKQKFDKNILVCVAGMTPQIILETLYALMKQGHRIDEIRVLTTMMGRDKIQKELLDQENGRFFNFCRDYGIDPKSITFDERMITLLRLPDGKQLEDIRTAEDNEHAANQICEIIRELTRDEGARIFASVAGGRKTMSIYLTTAMQLYARSWDLLSHVLVNQEFEGLPDFYYIPPYPQIIEVRDRQGNVIRTLSTENAEIHLAPISFIRLRGILGERPEERGRSYVDIVDQAQSNLDLVETSHLLRIDLRDRTVQVANRKVKLAEREFFIYLLFAWYRRSSDTFDGWRELTEITRSDLDTVFRLITAVREAEIGLEECASYPRYDFLANLAARIESDKLIDQEDLRKTFSETRARINRKLEGAELPSKFQIVSRGERGALRYGLGIQADIISWV